jgi:hypothetical protein
MTSGVESQRENLASVLVRAVGSVAGRRESGVWCGILWGRERQRCEIRSACKVRPKEEQDSQLDPSSPVRGWRH